MAEKTRADELYRLYVEGVNYAGKASKKKRAKDRMWRANQILKQYEEQAAYVGNLEAGFEQGQFETKLLQDRAAGAQAEFSFDQAATPDLQIAATEQGAAKMAAGELDNRRRRKASVEADPVLGI